MDYLYSLYDALVSINVPNDMEILSTTMTVRLGSMLIVGLSVLFAALKLTG